MENYTELWALLILLVVLLIFYEPALACMLVGGFLSALGVIHWRFLLYVEKRGIKRIGKVISYETSAEGGSTPIVKFETIQGRKISGTPNIFFSTSFNTIRTYHDKLNKAVAVLYHPKKPEKFVLGDRRDFNYLALLLFIVGGIGLIVLGILALKGIVKLS